MVEKRRGREEIEATWWRRGRKETEVARRIERGNEKERDPASNQFPKCSPPSGIHKRFTELGREEKGEGGDRGDLVEKKESKEEESSQASNLAPK